jgi:putative intracellular protease/amidase
MHLVAQSRGGGDEDSDIITRRFEKDADAEAQLNRAVHPDRVKQEDYDTVFYPGGHGGCGTSPEDKNSIKLIESFLAAGKPVALVCHAPGALPTSRPQRASRSSRARM